MTITRVELQAFLSHANLREHGDILERKYHDRLDGFGNYERFWRSFIVPLTGRMRGFPKVIGPDIRLRPAIPDPWRRIAASHYSIFANLLFAGLHLDARAAMSVQDAYVNLAATCDLAEAVMIDCHLIQLEIEGKQSSELQALAKDAFVAKVSDWYEQDYAKSFRRLLTRGKPILLRLHPPGAVLKEYLPAESAILDKYHQVEGCIRAFRNLIVHNALVGTIIVKNAANGEHETMIPKPSCVRAGKYTAWSEVEEATQNDEIVRRDFVEPYQQARGDLETLKAALNALWDQVIPRLEAACYGATDNCEWALADIQSTVEEATDFEATGLEITIANMGSGTSILGSASFSQTGGPVFGAGTPPYWSPSEQ